MTQDVNAIKLTELSTLLKIVFTLFLVMIGLAYLVSMVNLYLTYHLTDGKPGLSIDDLRRTFYGQRNQTLLAWRHFTKCGYGDASLQEADRFNVSG